MNDIIVGIVLGIASTLVSIGLVVLTHRIADHERRITDLENGKRQPQATDAALLDIIANVLEIDFNLDETQARLNTSKAKLDRVRDIIGQARQGPRSYGKD